MKAIKKFTWVLVVVLCLVSAGCKSMRAAQGGDMDGGGMEGPADGGGGGEGGGEGGMQTH